MHPALRYLTQFIGETVFFNPTIFGGDVTSVNPLSIQGLRSGHLHCCRLAQSTDMGKPISTVFFMYDRRVTYYPSPSQRGSLQIWLWDGESQSFLGSKDLNEPIDLPAGTIHLIHGPLGEIECFMSNSEADYPQRDQLLGADRIMAK